MTTMKAIVQEAYGSADLLQLRDVDRPVPGDDEVLVRVRAASVHPDVWHVVNGLPYVLRIMGAGLRSPKDLIPGTDVAGTVESVGKDVTRFKPGDDVFGESHRGHQWRNGRAYAEYAAVPEETLALKPTNITFAQAASVPTSGYIAISGLCHEGQVRAGQKVLINGAGGGVGALALQLAKAYGASVTAVDSTPKLDLLRTLGADRVIDYVQEDFTQGSERYDLIIDIPGNHSLSECRRALVPTGTYVLIGHAGFDSRRRRVLGEVPRSLGLVARGFFVSQVPRMRQPQPTKHDVIATLSEFLATGQLTPVIDRAYPLAEVPAALHYLQEGTALGRIVITI